MLNLPLYNTKKLLLSFEFGIVLSETASTMGVKLTPEIVERAEKVITAEFRKNSSTKLACDMSPIILAIFETN